MGLSCNKTNYSINPPFASRWRCPACQTVSCGFPCCSRPVTGYGPVSKSHTPSWNPSVEPRAGGTACDSKSGGWTEGPPASAVSLLLPPSLPNNIEEMPASWAQKACVTRPCAGQWLFQHRQYPRLLPQTCLLPSPTPPQTVQDPLESQPLCGTLPSLNSLTVYLWHSV